MLSKHKIKHNSKNQAIKSARKINHPSKKLTSQTKNRNCDIKLQAVNSKVSRFFEHSNIHEFAVLTKFIIRHSKITPFIFLYAVVLGALGHEISLDLLASNMDTIFKIDITGQSLSLRLNEKKSLQFLKSCFQSFLALQLASAFDNNYSTAFSMFDGVVLEDSTTIELNQCLAKNFKGSGGLASKSSLKLDWVFNICCFAAVAVDVYSGVKPDQKNAEKSVKHIKKGMLFIRDLGYYSVEAFKAISKKQAYYLSRLRKGALLYLNKDDSEALNTEVFFKKITAGAKSVTMPIYIDKKERFLTTLHLQKVPKWVHKQRLKHYKKRNSGKDPSKDFIVWAQYSVYISNIPDNLLTKNSEFGLCQMIMEIYKIRWQIELLFKAFKSKMKIHILKGKKVNHIRCLVYGKLISIILSLMVLSYAASLKHKDREVSILKVTSWLISLDRLANAILHDSLNELYLEFCQHFKLLCKDKRYRPTSLDAIQEVFTKNAMAA